ncbi:PD-(D/E)XK motif protein [Streptomyces poriferorum]|uniref:PD-(D/E)XK motif protein n=1 Tax=Streptomyces TaxID=1883 RepID=UPI00273FFDA4|nr:PD-(D/E)XK motif protein [Streptomyces sp. Alt1]WLQ48513.1 PD-(D/E)XK motif protein [Streptomyces sp. Alt1]
MTDGPYVPWTSVEHFLGANQSTTYRLSAPAAHPEVSYVVGDGHEIALHVELGNRHRPPQSPLAMIRIDQIAERGMRMARIRTTQAALVRDFHDLLNAVADRIITHDRTLEQAFGETVRAWSALLDRPRKLRVEKRIGLLGELSALAAIAHTHGWSTALQSWKGPAGEEHDFGLPGFDVEVKTTASEQRHHTIHGLGQLTPTASRPLWLVSLQITRGGAGGRTLSDCVRAVRDQVIEHAPASVDSLDAKLGASGWEPDAPDDERWRWRHPPLALAVNDELPRLEAECVPPHFRDRLRDVTYTLDVTGLAPSPEPPSELTDFRLS